MKVNLPESLTIEDTIWSCEVDEKSNRIVLVCKNPNCVIELDPVEEITNEIRQALLNIIRLK